MVKNTINKTKQKVLGWIADDKNEVTRVSIGGGIALAGFLYCCMLQTQAATVSSLYLFIKCLVGTSVMIGGLLLITRNLEPLNNIVVRLAKELVWFLLGLFGFCVVLLWGPDFKSISLAKELGLIASAALVISWVIHFIIFIVKIMKKALKKGVAKMVGKANNSSKIFGELLTNVVSIGGSIGLLYTMLKPLIDKIMGL